MSAITVPNLLTYFRMGASFVLLYFGILGRWDLAYPVFLAAAATDLIDGTIARVLRQRTSLGAFLDPVADKLLMFAGFLSLTMGGFLPWPVTFLVFTRDALISVGLVILKRSRVTIVYQPTYLSKFTTFFQILTVFAAFTRTQDMAAARSYLGDLPYDTLWSYVLGTTTALTAVTAVQYTRIGWRLLRG
ncbi:MAG TPA: CDP-alcohol phosphatidyltransferase family protein [bacterium]|nr:CDP-alcohol phosphatidyltransferase family protein [bacterium]